MTVRGLAAALVLVAVQAGAADIPIGQDSARLDVTSTSIAAWHANNRNGNACDDNFGAGLERLNLNAAWKGFALGLRLDGSLWAWKPQPQTDLAAGPTCYPVELEDRYVNTLIPEKVWAGWQGRWLEVTVGDSYATFGRGLALALRKTDELGVDTTQRGVKVRLRTERVGAALFAGLTNINNLDEASGRRAADPNDLVAGLQTDVKIADGIKLGAHGAMVAFREPLNTFGEDLAYRERWFSFGPVLDAPQLLPWLGTYAELLVQHRRHTDGVAETAYGATGSVNGRWGDWTATLEWKWYGALEPVAPAFTAVEFQTLQYTAAPTLERLLQPLEHTQSRTRGGRLRIDWAARPGLTVYLSDSLIEELQGYQNPLTFQVAPGLVQDPFAGLDATWGRTRVTAQGGMRFVTVGDGAGIVRTDGHADVSLSWGFGTGNSIDAHLYHLERGKRIPFLEEHWREGTLQVGFRRRPLFAVSAVLDYTTETGQPRTWYPGAAAEWDFTASSNVRLFVGSSRGGLKCVSGVCRTFPPFQGAKATLTLRF